MNRPENGRAPAWDGTAAALEKLRGLSADADGASVAEAVREFGEAVRGVGDSTVRMGMRHDAISALTAAKIAAPARWIDGVLSAPKSADETESDAQGRALKLREFESWPDLVDGAEMLDEIAATMRRFVVLPDGAAEAAALWVVFAHTIDAFDVAPLLNVVSPQMRCGKTTLMGLIAALVPRHLPVSNITAAALFRAVEEWKPTLLLDECDAFMAGNDELRGIVNSGHSRQSAFVVRTVGDSHEPRMFTTWCAKCVAGIGRRAATIEDRSITIRLRRKLPGERTERLRGLRIADELRPLGERIARWAADNFGVLHAATPAIPDGLNDRAADNWEPLLAIADAAGGEWPERARQTALLISADGATRHDESLPLRLLADVRKIFDATGVESIHSADLAKQLSELEESPWGEFGRNGKPITPTRIAKLLSDFDIESSQVKIGGKNGRGFRRSDFGDAWSRYLGENQPNTPSQSVTGVTCLFPKDLRSNQSVTAGGVGNTLNSPQTLAPQGGNTGNTLEAGDEGNSPEAPDWESEIAPESTDDGSAGGDTVPTDRFAGWGEI